MSECMSKFEIKIFSEWGPAKMSYERSLVDRLMMNIHCYCHIGELSEWPENVPKPGEEMFDEDAGVDSDKCSSSSEQTGPAQSVSCVSLLAQLTSPH